MKKRTVKKAIRKVLATANCCEVYGQLVDLKNTFDLRESLLDILKQEAPYLQELGETSYVCGMTGKIASCEFID